MNSKPEFFGSRRAPTVRTLLCTAAMGLGLGYAGMAWASEPHAGEPASKKPMGDVEASSASNPRDVGNQVRAALGISPAPQKKLTVVVKSSGHTATSKVTHQTSRAALQARAAADPHAQAPDSTHARDVHWDYTGEQGPQNWGKLKPDFNVCAIGKRQSPINIEDGNTLQGPAEPLQFNYTPSNGLVINNGHTIQVDVAGENYITVRNTNYRLVQFHFHTPSEEQINGKRFAMVAHLVHKSDEGRLAVVAVLLDPTGTNPMIDKVWTYMPLDKGDRVSMPRELLDLNELLPGDQRYYQFMGSLTTPPCTEGVLWLVLKQPVKISKLQLRLFTQLYPNNARPVQPVNGRTVRDAQ